MGVVGVHWLGEDVWMWVGEKDLTAGEDGICALRGEVGDRSRAKACFGTDRRLKGEGWNAAE